MTSLGKEYWLVVVLVVVLLGGGELGVEAHGDHGGKHDSNGVGDGAPPVQFNADELWDSQVLQNTEHIQEDLEEFFNMRKEDLSNLTAKELEYYYFELHDFDKNRKLDGLELMKAVIHMIDHGTQKIPQSSSRIDDFAVAIDQVMRTDDLDQDGYLSYAEFVLTMEKNMERSEKSKHKKDEN